MSTFVYVLGRQGEDYHEVLGVFSTWKLAAAYHDTLEEKTAFGRLYIEPRGLDQAEDKEGCDEPH